MWSLFKNKKKQKRTKTAALKKPAQQVKPATQESESLPLRRRKEGRELADAMGGTETLAKVVRTLLLEDRE